MTSIELHKAPHARRNRRISEGVASLAARIADAARAWNRQRRNRAAFMNLLEQEDWVYNDLGISRGDVHWAARLPMHINAAKELEKLRARSTQGY